VAGCAGKQKNDLEETSVSNSLKRFGENVGAKSDFGTNFVESKSSECGGSETLWSGVGKERDAESFGLFQQFNGR
jgi:hypothetical protein